MNINEFNWIDECEKYNDFYKENVSHINISFIFLSKNGNIERIFKEKYMLYTNNILSKEELIFLIKKQILKNKKKYSLIHIHKFNFDIHNDDIPALYNESIDIKDYSENMHSIRDIEWNDTINIFNDINELTIILMERKKKLNTTKKVYLTTHSKGTRRRY